jgi:hypothetical protein
VKIDRSAFTIDEFCSRNGFCRATYYNDRKRGQGPREMVIGGRVRISAAAEADWQHEREAERAAVNALQPGSEALIAPPAGNALTGGDKIAACVGIIHHAASAVPLASLDHRQGSLSHARR